MRLRSDNHLCTHADALECGRFGAVRRLVARVDQRRRQLQVSCQCGHGACVRRALQRIDETIHEANQCHAAQQAQCAGVQCARAGEQLPLDARRRRAHRGRNTAAQHPRRDLCGEGSKK